jgi:hypothetical protein
MFDLNSHGNYYIKFMQELLQCNCMVIIIGNRGIAFTLQYSNSTHLPNDIR